MTVRGFLEVESLPHHCGWWEQDVFLAMLDPRLGELGLMFDFSTTSTQARRYIDFRIERESAEKWQVSLSFLVALSVKIHEEPI